MGKVTIRPSSKPRRHIDTLSLSGKFWWIVGSCVVAFFFAWGVLEFFITFF